MTQIFAPGPGYDRPPTPGKQPDQEDPIEKYRRDRPDPEEEDYREYEDVPDDVINQEQKPGQRLNL